MKKRPNWLFPTNNGNILAIQLNYTRAQQGTKKEATVRTVFFKEVCNGKCLPSFPEVRMRYN